MEKTIKLLLAAVSVALLAACGGGGGGGGGGTAGNTTLKAGDLDGTYACVGGSYSFLFLTTGQCTDNQIIQGTCKRNITITSDKYFDYDGATASSLSLNVGVLQGPETKAYYYGRTNFGDRLIYERYVPVLNAGAKIGVATKNSSIFATSGTEYSLDGNRNLLITSYGPKSLPKGLTYSAESGGPGQIETTTQTCNRIATSGGGSSAPVPTISTFPLLTVLTNTLQASSNTFSISGIVDGVAVTGSGLVTRGALSAGTFEGSTAQQRTTNATGTFVVNGQNFPLAVSVVDWYNSNYSPLGQNGGEDYIVVVGSVVIPATVRLNDTATIYTANRYSDSSKTVLRGTETLSYVVEADTATTALLSLIKTQRDNSNTVTSIATEQGRITPTGTLTRIKQSATADSSTLTLTYK